MKITQRSSIWFDFYFHLQFLFVLFVCVAAFVAEEAESTEGKVEKKPNGKVDVVQPSLPLWKPLEKQLVGELFEQFDDSWLKRWVVSTSKKEKVEGSEGGEDILQYDGEWKVEEPIKYKVSEGDKGLVLKLAAHHHAISTLFKNSIKVIEDGKPFVVQYEVKLQDGLQCGGAYLKLLTADAKLDPKSFNDKTPYTIMFGPDRCGNEGKVHFILRHQNPLNGTISEKHLVEPPAPKSTTSLTTLYTLIIRPNSTYEIKINNEVAKKGSLDLDFDPPINPPKEIVDATDSKPEDWEDDEKIVDPEDTKPTDWVDEATIPDPTQSKPTDWLDDEPLYIADPTAQVPEDWNADEDGDWVAPEIPNPKCDEVSGCGEWKHPHVANPNYKGEWQPKSIANPKFKGVWEPRKVVNPDYYHDADIAGNLNPIGGLGFELWTMQGDILFDNIYVGHSEIEANDLAKLTWQVKFQAEEELKEALFKKDLPQEQESTITTYLNLLTHYATLFLQRTHLDHYFDKLSFVLHWFLTRFSIQHYFDILVYNVDYLVDLVRHGELLDTIVHSVKEFVLLVKKDPYESLNQMPYTAFGLFVVFCLVWAVIAKLVEFVFPPPELYDDMEARNRLAQGHNPYERKSNKEEQEKELEEKKVEETEQKEKN